MSTTLLFLPGASGNTSFWEPVAAPLTHPGRRVFLGYPGFGGVPADPSLRSFDDLVARVIDGIAEPVDLMAQSMGGVIALQAALRKPRFVRHLVLAATSGGIDVTALGAQDWRPMFAAANPGLPTWFLDDRTDLSDRLRGIGVPVLLLWGDADPISPVAVGQRLHALLPRAELVVVPGGTHDLVHTHAAQLAPQIDRFLQRDTLTV